MYYYNRPINAYVFIFVFALSMIIVLADEGKFTFMGVAISVLWGLVALGGGNLLWAFIGDIMQPYIHRNRDIYENDTRLPVSVPEQFRDNPPTEVTTTPFQNSGDEFERVVNKVINDGKIWARGMTPLENEEELQLRSYFKRRWTEHEDDITIPNNLKPSLVTKLQERGLVNDRELTTRGQRAIPWGRTYERVDGSPTV